MLLVIVNMLSLACYFSLFKLPACVVCDLQPFVMIKGYHCILLCFVGSLT
jgi:hypothetical protein